MLNAFFTVHHANDRLPLLWVLNAFFTAGVALSVRGALKCSTPSGIKAFFT